MTRVAKPGLKKQFWSLHLPRKTYRDGIEYYGTFPEGFEKKLKAEFPECFTEEMKPMLHLCSGMSMLGDVRVDINPHTNATLIADASNLEGKLNSETYGFCLLDPYYSDADFQKVNQTPVSTYAFVKEADRLVKKGGYIAILHQRPPRKPKDCELVGIVAISMGPDRLMRCLQVWRKL